MEAVSRLARGPLDWNRVLRLAAIHGLRPLLHRHLGAHAADAVPRDAFVALWADAGDRRRRNERLAAELVDLLAAFDAAGIRAMPYKGPTLAVEAYGDLALREFGDLDILVPGGDMDRACDVLAGRGYAADYPLQAAPRAAFFASQAQYHHTMRCAERQVLVELHWKSDPDFPVERLDDDAWWMQARRVALPCGPAPAMAPRELFLVLGLHGGKHHWDSLGWLVDIVELARVHPDLDWDWILGQAAGLGGQRRIGLGLRLAEQLLGAVFPGRVGAWAAASGVEGLVPRIARALEETEGPPASVLRGLRLDCAFYDRPAHRLRHLRRVVFAPTLIEWTRWPLPRPLGFLYPLLRLGRLGHKYLFRKGRGNARKSV